MCDENAAKYQRENEDLRQTIARLDAKLFDVESLLQANKAFDKVLEPRELYTIFSSIVHERFGVKGYALFILNERQTHFELVRGFGLPEDLPVGFSFPRQEGLLWQNIIQGKPFSVVDPSGQARFKVPFGRYGLDLLGAAYFLPLVHKSVVIGVLAFGPREDGAEFSGADMDFLEVLAAHAAVSFETSRLYKKNEEDKVELDRTVKNLSMLYNIGRAMIHISDLKNLLKFILGEAINTTEAQKGSLMLYDHAVDRLVVRVVKGLPDIKVEEAINNGEVACATFGVGEGIAGRVFKTMKPIIANATEGDNRYEARESSNVGSILCVPLVASEEPIGVINITNKKEGQPFSSEDVDLLTALANQAAVAINNASLYEMAITDELTKLYIRRFFNVRLETEVKRADRYRHTVTLAMCDLDHFKSVNDEFGHQVGDNTLVKLAEVMKASVREIDTAARFGGEEFAVILPETDIDGAKIMAERLRQGIAEANIAGLPRHVTISIGIACYPRHAGSISELIRRADTALYAAKETGRNRVCVYDPETMKEEVAEE